MTSENMPSMVKDSCCRIKNCMCDAIKKTKETYYECDFDIDERIHSGDPEKPKANMYKNGNIKIRLFDIIVFSAVMCTMISIAKIMKK